jgi:hypothetical protein
VRDPLHQWGHRLDHLFRQGDGAVSPLLALDVDSLARESGYTVGTRAFSFTFCLVRRCARGGIRTLTPKGHRHLKPACLPFHHSGSAHQSMASQTPSSRRSFAT